MTGSRATFSPISYTDLRLQQMNQLYAQSRLPQWLLLCTALMVTPLVWNQASALNLFSWLGALMLLALLRQMLVRRYWQTPPRTACAVAGAFSFISAIWRRAFA